MKNVILKSIMFLMVAVFAQGAAAQSVVVVNNAELVKAQPAEASVDSCRVYLVAHPQDTIRVLFATPIKELATSAGVIQGHHVDAGDTLLWAGYDIILDDKQLAARGKHYDNTKYVKKTVYVVDTVAVEALDKKAVETRFEYNITDGYRRDVYGYQLSHVIDSPDGKVISKAADKDGWGVVGEGSYQFGEGVHAVTGGLGLGYTGKWWKVDLIGGASRTTYSENAEHAGQKYWAFSTKASLWIQPFKLDKYDCNRIFLGVGPGWEHFKTDSQETEYGLMNSEGNYPFLHAGVMYEYRVFATGNSMYVKFEWRQRKWIIQNSDREVGNVFEITAGFQLGVQRNKINHK